MFLSLHEIPPGWIYFLTFGRVLGVPYALHEKLELGVLRFIFNGSLNSYLDQ